MLDRINLVPQKPLSSKLKSIIPVVIFFTLIFVLVAIQGQKMLLERRHDRVVSETKKLQRSIDNHIILLGKYTKQKNELTRLREEHSSILYRVGRLESLRQQKRIFSDILGGIANSMPPSIIFNKITFTGTSGVLLGEARGYEDLPDFVEALNDGGPLTDVSLTGINRSTRDGEMLFNFILTGNLAQNLQVQH